MVRANQLLEAPKSVPDRLPKLLARAVEPLPDVSDARFAEAFDRFGAARVVVLGEATQGTSEFYRARAAITRWLIERRGFAVVALDTDAADARVFDAYVRGREPPRGAADGSVRFPAWRWRNEEFLAFLDWLRDFNAAQSGGPGAGVWGLDPFNLAGSARAVIDYLDRIDPRAATLARRRFGEQALWSADSTARDDTLLTGAYASHGRTVVATLSEVLGRQAIRMAADGLLRSDQAARLRRDAEAQYGALYFGRVEGWNLRSAHMLETLDAVLTAQGPDAKAVVWTHNAQAGDSSATEMGWTHEHRNLGRRCRQVWGEEAVLIGLATSAGTLACASGWDTSMSVKRLNPPRTDSCEGLAQAAAVARGLLDLRRDGDGEIRRALSAPRRERFIGPLYNPDEGRADGYVDCRLAQQFDAWVWFEQTNALTPLPARSRMRGDEGVEPPPWPFGH